MREDVRKARNHFLEPTDQLDHALEDTKHTDRKSGNKWASESERLTRPASCGKQKKSSEIKQRPQVDLKGRRTMLLQPLGCAAPDSEDLLGQNLSPPSTAVTVRTLGSPAKCVEGACTRLCMLSVSSDRKRFQSVPVHSLEEVTFDTVCMPDLARNQKIGERCSHNRVMNFKYKEKDPFEVFAERALHEPNGRYKLPTIRSNDVASKYNLHFAWSPEHLRTGL